MADIHRNVNQLYDYMQIPYRTEQIRLPESIGTGYIQRFVPRSDMIVSITDLTLHEDRPVREEAVVGLLNGAMRVMSSLYRGEEPWTFLYVASEAGKSKLIGYMDDVLGQRKPFKWMPAGMKRMILQRMTNIPGYLIVRMKEGGSGDQRRERFAATCGLVQSFSVLAWEQGIGMVWSTDDTIRDPRYLSNTGGRPEERIVGTFCVGYFDRVPKARQRTPAAGKLVYVRDQERGGAEPLSRTELEALLDVAVWAPNHHHREPWRFVYSSGRLIVVAEAHGPPQNDYEDLAAACCAIHNFRWLARERGVHTEWVAGACRDGDRSPPDGAHGFGFELRGDEVVAGVLAISRGVPGSGGHEPEDIPLSLTRRITAVW